MKTFTQAMPDISRTYPDHWKLVDPYARLGLPSGSPLPMVKAHYKILARVYHPDKTGSAGTSTKFQAIAEAYRSITTQE